MERNDMVGPDTAKLILAKEGIFPITKDQNGNPLTSLPASGFTFPGTIQGEGKLNGVPSLFIRLAGCNLHCQWKTDSGDICACDTPHASFEVKNTLRLTTDEIYGIIRQNIGNIRHVVITGGEPFLQADNLKHLCNRLNNDNIHITIETNATIYDENVARYIDLFSMSPKLASSVSTAHPNTYHEQLRLNTTCIQSFISHALRYNKDFQLKFVYSSENDIAEIQTLLSGLNGWKNEDILLMPLGITSQMLRMNMRKVLGHCIRNGWRYCDRLHISLFGAKEGV